MSFELIKLFVLIAVAISILPLWKSVKKKPKAIQISGKWNAIYQMPFKNNASLLIVTEQQPDNTVISKSMFRPPMASENIIKILSTSQLDTVTRDAVLAIHEAVLQKYLLDTLSEIQTEFNITYLKPISSR